MKVRLKPKLTKNKTHSNTKMWWPVLLKVSDLHLSCKLYITFLTRFLCKFPNLHQFVIFLSAFLYIKARALAAAACYTYHPMQYTGLYSATEALYQPVYMPPFSMYHAAPAVLPTDLGTCTTSPPSKSPPAVNTPISTGSRA